MSFDRNQNGGFDDVACTESIGTNPTENTEAGSDTAPSVPALRSGPWTPEEDGTLLTMFRQLKTDLEIGDAIGRSAAGVKARRRVLGVSKANLTPAQRKQRERAATIRRRDKRTAFMREHGGHYTVDPRPENVPPEIFEERERAYRYAACRTVTQVLFGDPPPGRSALDAERAVRSAERIYAESIGASRDRALFRQWEREGKLE